MEIGPKILVVDDEDELRALLETLLESNGYTVFEASTANAAMDRLSSQQIDLVLLDITLLDGDGLKVLQFVRAKGLVSKVIVLTGTGGFDIALKCAAFGVQDYISKPFKPHHLLTSIKHVLSIEVSN